MFVSTLIASIIVEWNVVITYVILIFVKAFDFLEEFAGIN